jgi:hypothetical protein
MRRNFEKSLAPLRLLLRYCDLPGCLPKGVALCARHLRSRSAVRTANRTTNWFAPKQIRNRRKGKLRVASAARPSMAARVTWSSSISWLTSRDSKRGFCELGRQLDDKCPSGTYVPSWTRCRGSKPGKGAARTAIDVSAWCAGACRSPRRTDMSEVGWKTEVCASPNRHG